MITCRLQGGLGNQMFQVAATTALAMELKTKAIFDLGACHTPAQGFTSNKYKNSIFNLINDEPLNTVKFTGVYTEPKFSFSELPKQDNIILNGYFQSEKYFVKYKKYIKRLFNIPEETLDKVELFLASEVSEHDTITSVHVRRGDYLNLSDYHAPCDVEYYKKAMEKIGDSKFVFISDDIEWCKDNFKGDNIYFSPFKDEIEDLALMSICDNQIIANSSFSWWGAYLCIWEDNITIAPSNWFGPKGPKDQQDIIPKDWIKF
jgi:hypothetical protein